MLQSFEKYPLYVEGGVLYKKENSSKDEFLAVVSYYEDMGFAKKYQNSFGGAYFCTLINGEKTVNVTYKGKGATLRITEENGTNLPICESSAPVCDTLITQVKTTFWNVDCGMSYIIRLGDGTFCVIDGGMAEEDEKEHFYEVLNDQKVTKGVPTIKAWFLTHPHCDHHNLFLEVAPQNGKNIKIENLILNWPHTDYSDSQSANFIEVEPAAKSAKISIIVARTGYRFELCESVFEIIQSPEDIMPRVPVNVNDTSIVIMQTVGDKNILYPGDSLQIAADKMIEEYESDCLKADILQVAHHGYWGGSDAFYRAVDPEILLWPVPEFAYYRMYNLDYNDYLKSSNNVKKIFPSNRCDTVININTGEIKNEENTSLCADFSVGSMTRLGWDCVTGGSTGYKGAKAEFSENSLTITTVFENKTLVTMMPMYRMQGKDSYTFELDIDIKHAKKLGLICNYDEVHIYDESKVIDLCPESGKAKYVLCADEKGKKLTLTKNGQSIFEAEYIPDIRHGIYLVMQEAKVEITKAEVVKKGI